MASQSEREKENAKPDDPQIEDLDDDGLEPESWTESQAVPGPPEAVGGEATVGPSSTGPSDPAPDDFNPKKQRWDKQSHAQQPALSEARRKVLTDLASIKFKPVPPESLTVVMARIMLQALGRTVMALRVRRAPSSLQGLVYAITVTTKAPARGPAEKATDTAAGPRIGQWPQI